MIRGIYTAATGMTAQIEKQNAIANNLANVDTIGYKRDDLITTPFKQLLLNAYSKQGQEAIGPLGLGVENSIQYTDFNPGILLETGNQHDLALSGPGLFAIQTPAGVRYSRAGNFELDKSGYLVTKNGFQVLGENGPIRLTEGFQVNGSGEIFQNGQLVAKLQIVNEQGMIKNGEGYQATQTPTPAGNYRVNQGMLERSNVNPINEMIQMINVSRNYETNQKVLWAHDETLGKVINELAK